MATAEQVRAATGSEPGFLGPVGLKLPGRTPTTPRRALADFVCGANRRDVHLTGVNWGRDLPEPEVADLRNVVAGDPSPSGSGTLGIARGIEVGHIFQLGRKYSEAMNATVLDEQGKAVTMLMGCYGIGVTRVVAAAIEQNHDERGIIWPEPIAPFDVSLVPINLQKSERVREVAERLYGELQAAGIEVLFDDRDARPGREVRRRRAARHPAPHRGRRPRPRARRARVPARAGGGRRGRADRVRRAVPAGAERHRPLTRACGRAALTALLLVTALPAAAAHADRQLDPELRGVLAEAIAADRLLRGPLRARGLVHLHGAAAAALREGRAGARADPAPRPLRGPPRATCRPSWCSR